MSSARALRLLLALSALTCCAPLPEIVPNECWNEVLEPGEACDKILTKDQVQAHVGCGSPEESPERACRFVCDGGFVCPGGWACGADRICRLPSATFTAVRGWPLPIPADTLATGDLDGDGFPDLVAGRRDEIQALFGDGQGGVLSQHHQVSSERSGALVVRDVDGDGRDDVIAPISQGADILLGTTDRTLTPRLFSYITGNASEGTPVPIRSFRVFMAHLGLPCISDQPGFLAIVEVAPGSHAIFGGPFDAGTPGFSSPIDAPDLDLNRIRGPLPMADLNGDGFAEIALALPGNSQLILTAAAAGGPNGCDISGYTLEAATVVSLGNERIEGRTHFVDVDGDGSLDLLVGTRSTAGPAGEIHHRVVSAPVVGAPLASLPDLRTIGDLGECNDAGRPTFSGEVLAGAQLDGAGGGDLVLPSGVFLSSGATFTANGLEGALCRIFVPPGDSTWRDAVITDINGDGSLDVVAAPAMLAELHVLISDGQLFFNSFVVPISGPARDLRSGDFDGDRFADVVFATEDPDDESAPLRLSTLYGGPLIGEYAPITMGNLTQLRFIETGSFQLSALDARTDLLLELDDGDPGRVDVTIASGTSSRRLLAPIVLQTPDGDPSSGVNKTLAAFVGRFYRDDAIDDVITVEERSEPDQLLGLVAAAGDESGRLFSGAPVAAKVHVPAGSNDPCGFRTPKRCQFSSQRVRGSTDGREELVAVSDCPGEDGLICVITPGGDRGVERVCKTENRGPDGVIRGLKAITSVDLDQDGAQDLLVVFEAPGDSPGGVALQLADDKAACVYATGQRTPVAYAPGSARVQNAVALNLDADRELEVAVLTSDGLYVADPLSGSSEMIRVDVPGAWDREQPAVTAADFDGDRIADLLIGSAREITLLHTASRTAPDPEEATP